MLVGRCTMPAGALDSLSVATETRSEWRWGAGRSEGVSQRDNLLVREATA
jgi:hypothetical protein